MASSEERDSSRFDHVLESLDLLFAKVGQLDTTQQRMATQMDLGNQVMEQMLKDQQSLSKQVEATGQAIARFSSSDIRPSRRQDPSSSSGDIPAHRPFQSLLGGGGDHSGGFRHGVPKMSFPKFTGVNPRIWKDKCLDYFHLFNVPEGFWATMASLNMDGQAAKWLQVYKLQVGLGSWHDLITAVETQFGSFDYRDAIGELIALKQTGSLEDYIVAFQDLRYSVSMHNTGLGELYFTTQFVKGLKSDIRGGVQCQVPDSVNRAILLARVQQQVLDSTKFRYPKSSVSGKAFATPAKSETKSTTATSSLWKERQLRNYRKANGLCMYCGDKYDAAHAASCTLRPQHQANALVVNDLDQPLTDEILTQLAVEDSMSEEFEQLSLNALAGTAHGDALQLRSLVANKVMLVLIDSGSSHSFVSSSFLQTVGIQPIDAPPKNVKMANGQVLLSNKMVPHMEWWCQGHTLTADMRVLDLSVYDAILGYDWLKTRSPMICQWDKKIIEFEENGHKVTLKGIQPVQHTISCISAASLIKSCKGNDIWAFAVLSAEPSTPPELPSEIATLLQEYADVFAKPTTLPPSRVYDHTIPLLPNTTPVNSRPYRYSPLHKTEIERQVKDLLAAGLITQSTSPFAFPVLLVLKKDGTWRFCVDYRKLNELTIKNRFPLPVIEEILDELAGTQFFTKLDMSAGFHQIRMCPADEHKTAFKTHHGHFQFRVMPFGLTNAPATFQCMMNDILQPFLRKFVLVFLDDILIYSPTWEAHLTHLRQVLDQLRIHQFYLKSSKCSFAQTEIAYLGHVISQQGVSTDPTKTAAMLKWPTPTSVTELRGFLGLTGYYRRFVQHYGLLARPLTQLLKKKQFAWSPAAELAFTTLKQAMTQTPVLVLPNFDDPFVVETDACATGIGAVLMQHHRPVAFLSKALGPTHQHLSIYEKEFLALIMAIEKWRSYLQRQEFTILTDHKSLSYLTEQNLQSDLQRKAMTRLMGLQFKVVYRKGRENLAADALSRVGHLMALQAISATSPAWLQAVLNSYHTDEQAQQLLQSLSVHSPNEQGFSLTDGLIRYKDHVWIGHNSALRTKVIAALHSSPIGGHSGIQATYYRVKKLFHWKGLKKDVEDFVKQCSICQHSKHEHTNPGGLLQPLPIPAGAWQDISLDFIEGLPLSQNANVILVVVDRFTKYSHFLSLKHPFTAHQVALLLLDSVVKLHGLPKTMVSDRDKIFLSTVWQDLFTALGTKLLHSTAYHPQTDGQTERVNQCLEMYLRCAVYNSPKLWRQWLPLAELWYNSSLHTSLGCSPFKALYGYDPDLGVLPASDLPPTTEVSVMELIQDREQHMDMLKEQLTIA